MTAVPLPAPAARPAFLPALWQLTLAESRRLSREPMFAMGTVGFPVLFYSLFGLPREGMPPEFSRDVLLSMAAFSLVSLSLFSFGVNVATERTEGWLRLLRAAPMPGPAYLIAKVLAAWLYGGLAVLLLLLYAGLVGGVWLGTGVSALALVKLLLGLSPLVALGLALGFTVRPAAAVVVANIASLLLVFGSGLAMPLQMLPGFVARAAPYLPTYHLGVVGKSPVNGAVGEPLSWLVLLGYTLLFGAVAAVAMRRDETRE